MFWIHAVAFKNFTFNEHDAVHDTFRNFFVYRGTYFQLSHNQIMLICLPIVPQ